MRNVLIVWRRELGALFLSPLAYGTLAAFLALGGATFLTGVVRNLGSSETLPSLLCGAALLWLTALVTVVSMRLFAEERRSGTLEALMTAPVTEPQVVLGKYAGALSFVLFALALLLANVWLLGRWDPQGQTPDYAGLIGSAVILGLNAAFWTSIGLLVSILTRHPMAAALTTFCLIWFAVLFGWLVAGLPLGWQALGEQISTLSHVEMFARGVLDTRPIVLYGSGTLFFLFTAVRVLESRRWW